MLDNPLENMSTDTLMDLLTVVASDLITDYSDCRDRGYLKEHPNLVIARLDILTDLINTVGNYALEELDAGKWSPMADDEADRQLADAAKEYGSHTCNCDYCLHATGEV